MCCYAYFLLTSAFLVVGCKGKSRGNTNGAKSSKGESFKGSVYEVKGMTCVICKNNVEKGLKKNKNRGSQRA